jgi:RimJ/RimL family protein N-acetyltransferase
LGYDLSPEFWGRGIATDAVAATVDAAFRDSSLSRVDAFVMVENVRSQRVLEKCGFEKEGRLARYRHCRGNFRDFYLYARVRAV